MIKSGLALHCHHDALWEYCYDYDGRVKYILENKPREEHKLRLRLFQIPDQNLLPGRNSEERDAFDKAWNAYNEASGAYNEASGAYNEASGAYVKAEDAYNEASGAYVKAEDAYLDKYGAELDELHRQLCPDCPWDGKTIFSIKGGE